MKQDELFSTSNSISKPASKLVDSGLDLNLENSTVTLFSNFYPCEEATILFKRLFNETVWQQDKITIAGKQMLIPRLQAWYGNKEAHYGYSGGRFIPQPWTSTLSAIRDKLQIHCQKKFNSVLINLYRNGSDSVAWHADDETELGNNPTIASLSLGSTRTFQIKPSKNNKQLNRRTLNCQLEHGSLIVMGEGFQYYWLHQVPKQPGLTEPRINLTFRYINSN